MVLGVSIVVSFVVLDLFEFLDVDLRVSAALADVEAVSFELRFCLVHRVVVSRRVGRPPASPRSSCHAHMDKDKEPSSPQRALAGVRSSVLLVHSLD